MEQRSFNFKTAEKGRLYLDLRLSYVANLLGISEDELSQIERGAVAPTDNTLEMMSTIYAIPVSDFFEPDKTPMEHLLEFQRQVSAEKRKQEEN